MNETMKSLQYETKAIDVTEKGIVTVAVNGTGIEDSQHDISMPGSFVDTVRDDIAKMRWFLNHDTRQLLGVPLSGQEKDGNLIMTGQINLNKQIGRDVLEDYKLFAAAGRTLEHSIGVKAVARDEEDRRKVLKWKMFEYSTLTGWGANPNTYLVGIKSATSEQLREYAEFIRMAFKQHGYSDERLKHYDMELNLLLKSLSGGLVVKCPCCGRTFDYEQYAEHTFSQEVQDAAISWLQDVTRRETEVQLEAYRPEIQTEVMSVIDSLKASAEILTEKSITNVLKYVRCPHCWSRVYRSNSILTESEGEDTTKGCKPEDEEDKKPKKGCKPEDDDDDDDEEEKKPCSKSAEIPSPSFWAQLNNSIKK